jgi:hypothetical protein
MADSKTSWSPIIRKFETLVFAAMVVVIPFFAFRIVDTAGTALMVQNTTADLVKDLIKAQEIARDFHLSVTVTSAPPTLNEPSSYLIQSDSKTIEQVILPNGVNIAGAVTFNDGGLPKTPSSFMIGKAGRSTLVLIDRNGKVR